MLQKMITNLVLKQRITSQSCRLSVRRCSHKAIVRVSAKSHLFHEAVEENPFPPSFGLLAKFKFLVVIILRFPFIAGYHGWQFSASKSHSHPLACGLLQSSSQQLWVSSLLHFKYPSSSFHVISLTRLAKVLHYRNLFYKTRSTQIFQDNLLISRSTSLITGAKLLLLSKFTYLQVPGIEEQILWGDISLPSMPEAYIIDLNLFFS